jgi:hypothetical protein
MDAKYTHGGGGGKKVKNGRKKYGLEKTKTSYIFGFSYMTIWG